MRRNTRIQSNFEPDQTKWSNQLLALQTSTTPSNPNSKPRRRRNTATKSTTTVRITENKKLVPERRDTKPHQQLQRPISIPHDKRRNQQRIRHNRMRDKRKPRSINSSILSKSRSQLQPHSPQSRRHGKTSPDDGIRR